MRNAGLLLIGILLGATAIVGLLLYDDMQGYAP